MKKSVHGIWLGGYVNRAGTRSRCVFQAYEKAPGPYVECVQPGAFRRALLFPFPNVLLTVDHGRVIGSTWGGELRLEEDAAGLRALALIRDAEAIHAAQWGQLRGWSFSFFSLGVKWEQIGAHLYRRTVRSLILHDIALILRGSPAYPGTTVNLVKGDRYDHLRD